MSLKNIEQEDFYDKDSFPDLKPNRKKPVFVNSYLDHARSGASPDPVTIYLTEIRKIPLLTHMEELKLGQKIRKGDEEKEFVYAQGAFTTKESVKTVAEGDLAAKELTEHNLRLVSDRARKFLKRGLSMMDLIQEGNIGLEKAVHKFDERKGYKFSTYATWWIEQAMRRAIAENGRTIRIPEHMIDEIKVAIKVTERLVQELGRTPKISELALSMGISEEKLIKIRQYNQLTLSLDSPVGEEDNDRGENRENFGDFIIDRNVDIPESIIKKEEQELVRKVLYSENSQLTDRQRRVLEMRFGIRDGRSRTLEEIGIEIGVSRERIRQIEAEALRKFTEDLEKYHPQEYAERLEYPINPKFKRPAAFVKEVD